MIEFMFLYPKMLELLCFILQLFGFIMPSVFILTPVRPF